MFCCCKNKYLPKIIDARDIQAQIDYLNSAVLIQAETDHNEAEKRRQQIAKTRHELLLRIQELDTLTTHEKQSLITRLNEIVAEYDRQLAIVTTELYSEVSLRESLSARVSENKALIENEMIVRADAYSAEAIERQRLEASIKEDVRASIEREAIARATAFEAEALEREKLEAKVGRDIIAAIETEAYARASGDEAEASIREQLIAKVSEEITASIQSEVTARANADEALTRMYQNLSAQIAEDIRSAIEIEVQARTTADEAEAALRIAMSAQVAENKAAIENEAYLRATADSVEAEARRHLEVQFGEDLNAAIENESLVRATADEAEAALRIALSAEVAENKAAIESETLARTTADSAEALERERLSTRVDENNALILEERQVLSDFQSASATERRQLLAQIGDLAEGIFNNSKSIHEGEEWRRQNLAFAREELHAEITAEHEARASRELELLAAIDSNTAFIYQEQQARANADEAEAHSREELEASLKDEISSAITTERQARVDADGAISTDITNLRADVDDNSAEIRKTSEAIVDLQNDIVSALDKRELIARLDALDEAVLNNSSSLNNEGGNRRQNLAAARESLSAEITAEREARVKRDLELFADIAGNTAAIEQEQQARANADEAEAHSREILSAQVTANTNAIQDNAEAIDTNRAAIEQERQVRANADEAEAGLRETLESKVNANTAAIQLEAQTRAEADSAIASTTQTLRSDVNSNTSSIQSEITARTTADSALSTRIDTLGAKVGDNTAAIQSEAQTRATNDSALSGRIDTLTTKVDNNTSAIQRESEARADSENANAYDKRTIQARLNELDEAVLNNASSIQETGEARREALAVAQEELSAEITAEQMARAKRELELLAKINGNTSLIAEEQTARANADSALANRTSTLESTVGSSTSGLVKRVTTLETDISGKASASDVTTLQTTVNGHTTSIQTLNEVKADLSGITGRHFLKIDNDGYVVGTELYNGGTGESKFVINADHFVIRHPVNKMAVLNYNSTTGTLTLKNLVADTAIIQDATIYRAKIAANQISSISAYTSEDSVPHATGTHNVFNPTILAQVTANVEKGRNILILADFEQYPQNSSSYTTQFFYYGVCVGDTELTHFGQSFKLDGKTYSYKKIYSYTGNNETERIILRAYSSTTSGYTIYFGRISLIVITYFR